jgi:hypothetical protein
MSEASEKFKAATYVTRMNVRLREEEQELLAMSLVYFNRHRRGDMPFAYMACTNRPSRWVTNLVDRGYYEVVQDKRGKLLGVDLSDDVGLPAAITAVSCGHCPVGMLVSPDDTVNPFTGKQLLPELFSETVSLPEDTGYRYAAKATKPTTGPVKEQPQPAAAKANEVKAAELDEIIDKEAPLKAAMASMHLERERDRGTIERLQNQVRQLKTNSDLVEQIAKLQAKVSSQEKQHAAALNSLQLRLVESERLRKQSDDARLRQAADSAAELQKQAYEASRQEENRVRGNVLEIKRLREANEQMGKVRLEASAMSEKLEQSEKTANDLQFRLNTALQQQKHDAEVLDKAELQIDQLIYKLKQANKTIGDLQFQLSTVFRPKSEVIADSPDALNAAVAEFASFSDQIAANAIAAKHGVTAQAMRDAARAWLVAF